MEIKIFFVLISEILIPLLFLKWLSKRGKTLKFVWYEI